MKTRINCMLNICNTSIIKTIRGRTSDNKNIIYDQEFWLHRIRNVSGENNAHDMTAMWFVYPYDAGSTISFQDVHHTDRYRLDTTLITTSDRHWKMVPITMTVPACPSVYRRREGMILHFNWNSEWTNSIHLIFLIFQRQIIWLCWVNIYSRKKNE